MRSYKDRSSVADGGMRKQRPEESGFFNVCRGNDLSCEASSAKIRGIKYEPRQRCHNELKQHRASTSPHLFCKSKLASKGSQRVHNCVYTYVQLWQTATADQHGFRESENCFLGAISGGLPVPVVLCISSFKYRQFEGTGEGKRAA